MGWRKVAVLILAVATLAGRILFLLLHAFRICRIIGKCQCQTKHAHSVIRPCPLHCSMSEKGRGESLPRSHTVRDATKRIPQNEGCVILKLFCGVEGNTISHIGRKFFLRFAYGRKTIPNALRQITTVIMQHTHTIGSSTTLRNADSRQESIGSCYANNEVFAQFAGKNRQANERAYPLTITTKPMWLEGFSASVVIRLSQGRKLFGIGRNAFAATWLLLLSILVLTNSVFAQGTRRDFTVINSQGRPVAGASVLICTSGALTPEPVPCTPPASIYSDITLSTVKTNPFKTDANGNGFYYAAPGTYKEQISGSGITTSTTPDLNLSAACGLPGVRCVDGVKFTGADLGAAINAAAADAGAGGIIVVPPSPFSSIISTALVLPLGTVLKFPTGVFRFNVGSTVSNANVAIEGMDDGGQTEFHLGTATLTLFTVTGASFRFRNVFVGPSAGITRTAGAILKIQAGGGTVDSIHIQDPFQAFFFVDGNGDSWSFSNIRIQSAGGNWDSLFGTSPLASGTITSVNIQNVIGTIATAGTISAPLILLDSGVDGWSFVNWEAGMSGSSTNIWPVLKIQKGGAAQAPSWLRFTNFIAEVGTAANVVEISDGRDIGFEGSYFTSSLRGVSQAGGTGIRYQNSIFLNNQREGLLVDGGTDWSVQNCDFSDNSVAGNGSYIHLSVAAGVSDFRIANSHFGNNILGNANKAQYGIAIVAGASTNYTLIGNVGINADFTGAFISDSGTGTAKAVIGNQPSVANTLGASDLGVRRIKASTGTALVAGDFALSAGWGNGPGTVTSVRGTDQFFEFIVTSVGTGQGASPTITHTPKDGTWTTAPIWICERQEFVSQATVRFTVTTQTATSLVLTFGGTPASAETFKIACHTGGI